MTKPFAAETKVSASQSRADIERLLMKHKATHIGYASQPGRAILGFQIAGRMVRFSLEMPDPDAKPQKYRSRWRAMLLCVKAKLESVAANIETFDEAFLANVVMPDGKTLAEHAIPHVEAAYKSGTMPPLLTFGG
jgi:hypothetical protein